MWYVERIQDSHRVVAIPSRRHPVCGNKLDFRVEVGPLTGCRKNCSSGASVCGGVLNGSFATTSRVPPAEGGASRW